MTEPNPERGEHEIELAGVSYTLRPSHQAIRAIEKKTKRSLLELVRLSHGGGLTSDELGAVAGELIRAGADREDELTRMIADDRIAELIYEAGTYRAIARLMMVLTDAAGGGRTATGEAKAATATIEDAGAA